MKCWRCGKTSRNYTNAFILFTKDKIQVKKGIWLCSNCYYKLRNSKYIIDESKMSEKKIEYEQCDCCGWKESPIVDIDDFGKSCCFNCFINYNPKAKKEYDNQLKKAQQDLIKKIEKLVNKRIKELKTDANNNKEAETKIVLKNCANELKYFWKDVKKEVEK